MKIRAKRPIRSKIFHRTSWRNFSQKQRTKRLEEKRKKKKKKKYERSLATAIQTAVRPSRRGGGHRFSASLFVGQKKRAVKDINVAGRSDTSRIGRISFIFAGSSRCSPAWEPPHGEISRIIADVGRPRTPTGANVGTREEKKMKEEGESGEKWKEGKRNAGSVTHVGSRKRATFETGVESFARGNSLQRG